MAETCPVRFRCYAKVNLTLEVLGRRPDGYHDLASVARTISLADELYVAAADRLSVAVEGMDLPAEENLVLRAAHLLANGRQLGAAVRLEKHVPAAAGLGGGSADAAATLVALNRLWGTRLAAGALHGLAALLGSDVPFFLRGGAAVIRGRGDVVDLLPGIASQWIVLVVPPHSLENKTAALYRALTPADYSDGSATNALAARLTRDEPARDADLVNAFERPARKLFAGLDALWATLERSTGRRFHLSGAGPSLFALAADRRDARKLARRVDDPSLRVYALRTVTRGFRPF